MDSIRKGDGLVWPHEKNKPRIGANPASRWFAPRIGFAFPHMNTAVLIVPPVHPSSGSFGQILSPPQRLPTAIPLSVSFCDCQKRTIISYVMINEHLSHRRRWGADRICPNGPDEGTSKTAKLDCESEDKQIRLSRPEGGFKRGLKTRSGEQISDLRFAPIRGWFLSHVSTGMT